MSFRTRASTVIAAVSLGLALAGPGGAAPAPHIVIPRLGLDMALSRRSTAGRTVYYRDSDTLAIAAHRTT